jgi:hypothetical protein
MLANGSFNLDDLVSGFLVSTLGHTGTLLLLDSLLLSWVVYYDLGSSALPRILSRLGVIVFLLWNWVTQHLSTVNEVPGSTERSTQRSVL